MYVLQSFRHYASVRALVNWLLSVKSLPTSGKSFKLFRTLVFVLGTRVRTMPSFPLCYFIWCGYFVIGTLNTIVHFFTIFEILNACCAVW